MSRFIKLSCAHERVVQLVRSDVLRLWAKLINDVRNCHHFEDGVQGEVVRCDVNEEEVLDIITDGYVEKPYIADITPLMFQVRRIDVKS